LDCSSIKAVRDLSSERRETVRFLSLLAKVTFWYVSVAKLLIQQSQLNDDLCKMSAGSEYERTRLLQTSGASVVYSRHS
jgi:hypothetical protein